MADKTEIKNIIQAFQILDEIVKKEEIGISDLSSILNLPKTTVFRIVKTLEQIHAIQQVDNGKYILDYKMLLYAKSTSNHHDLVKAARNTMKEIVSLTGETVNIGVCHENQVLVLASEIGEYYLLQAQLLPTSPLYCSSMGKLFLSHFTDAQLQDYFVDLKKRTIHTIVEYDVFKKQQIEILHDKFATDKEEYEYGLTCLAAPIFDHQGNIRAAMSISGPDSRLSMKGIETLINQLKKQVTQFSEQLIENNFWVL